MSEYAPLSTQAEYAALDDEECVAGYHAGLCGDSEPGSDKSKSYWHGWRNGMIDSGRIEYDDKEVEPIQHLH
jgi:ribosome modulation factor